MQFHALFRPTSPSSWQSRVGGGVTHVDPHNKTIKRSEICRDNLPDTKIAAHTAHVLGDVIETCDMTAMTLTSVMHNLQVFIHVWS
jgi:hypothetical protein